MSGIPETKPSSFPLEKKEKVTFNLPVELLRQLDEVWMKIRKASSRKKVSKTLIVETVLRQAFREMESHQEHSSLYTELVQEE